MRSGVAAPPKATPNQNRASDGLDAFFREKAHAALADWRRPHAVYAVAERRRARKRNSFARAPLRDLRLAQKKGASAA